MMMEPRVFVKIKPAVRSESKTIVMQSSNLDETLRLNLLITIKVSPPPVQRVLPAKLRLPLRLGEQTWL